MNTVLIPKKEYKQILKTQDILSSQVSDLKKFIANIVANDELNVRTVKKLEKISKDIDGGKGKRFNTVTSLKTYLRNI